MSDLKADRCCIHRETNLECSVVYSRCSVCVCGVRACVCVCVSELCMYNMSGVLVVLCGVVWCVGVLFGVMQSFDC